MLVEQRNEWRSSLERGEKLPLVSMHIDVYHKHRNSDSWRGSKVVEQFCEYIIYLESEIEALQSYAEDYKVNRGRTK